MSNPTIKDSSEPDLEDGDNSPAWSRLWEIEAEIKAISFLIESHDPECPQPLPWDMQDVYAGLGRLIWKLADRIAEIRRELESDNIKKAQAKTPKKTKLSRKRGEK